MIPPGTLRLIRSRGNPHGAPDAELFMFVGDVAAPIERIIPDADVRLPEPHVDFHQSRVRILHVGDLHGHIARVSARNSFPVFSRLVSQVRQVRREAANDRYAAAIFLSSGDDLVGAPFEELLCNASFPERFHPTYRLYAEAGLDVAILGNHEFDVGTRLLAKSIRSDTNFPILCANLTNCPRLDGLVFPAALLVVKGIRVGLVGLTTAAEIVHPDDSGFIIKHPVAVAQDLLPAIRPMCDVLILVTHLGLSLGATSAVVRDAGDVELAQSLPQGLVDLIIGAHTHIALNERELETKNVVNGIPIVHSGGNGDWLGDVDIVFDPRPTIKRACLRQTKDLAVDEEFDRAHVQPMVAQVRALLAEPLGRVSDLGLDKTGSSLDLRTESVIANFVNDAIAARCRAAGYTVDFAMLDSSAISCELLPNSELTFEDCFKLMPHADIVRIFEITGRRLKSLLDDNARRAVHSGAPSTDSCFAQFSREVRYTIELGSMKADAQATNVRVNHVPLDDLLERTFRFACSSFARQRDMDWQAHAASNQWTTVSLWDLSSFDTPLRIRDELVAFIRDHGGISADAGARRDGRVRIV